MPRPMTRSEVEELHHRRIAAGAVGRNAFVCKCGHIDYRPNNETFVNCIFIATDRVWSAGR